MKKILWLIILFLAFHSYSFGKGMYKISVNDLTLKNCERIEKFKMKFKGGQIVSLPTIPEDWTFNLNNWDVAEQPNWTGNLTAHIHVGADAVGAGLFRNYLLVSVGDLKGFELNLEIYVTNGDVVRKIRLTRKDVLLSPFSEKDKLVRPDLSWSCKKVKK